mgnify:CR=1 FL=1
MIAYKALYERFVPSIDLKKFVEKQLKFYNGKQRIKAVLERIIGPENILPLRMTTYVFYDKRVREMYEYDSVFVILPSEIM